MPTKKITFSRELIFLIIVIVFILITAFLIYLQAGSLIKTRQAADNEVQNISQLQTRLITLQKLKEQYPELQAKLAFYEMIMPSVPSENTILTSIQGTANDTNTGLLQIRFESEIKKEQYVEIPLKVSFQGEYRHLAQLLDKIRNGHRAFRVDEVKITQSQEANQYSGVMAEISASAFYTTAGESQAKK